MNKIILENLIISQEILIKTYDSGLRRDEVIRSIIERNIQAIKLAESEG